MPKFCASIISDAYKADEDYITRFTDIGDAPTETRHSVPQASNVTGAFHTPTLLHIVAPRPSTSRLVPTNYVSASQLFLSKVMKRLSTMETKV